MRGYMPRAEQAKVHCIHDDEMQCVFLNFVLNMGFPLKTGQNTPVMPVKTGIYVLTHTGKAYIVIQVLKCRHLQMLLLEIHD